MAGRASHLRLLSNRDETLPRTAGLGDVVELYRAAQRLGTEDFINRAFHWLRRRIAFDQGIMVPVHARVRDLQGQLLVANPGRAHRLSDLDRLSREPAFAPMHEHSERFKAREALGIAVSRDPGEVLSVVVLVRERRVPFTDAGKRELEAAAPHVVEASTVNRTCWLLNHGGANQESRPLALLNADGRFLWTTDAFCRLFWGARQAGTSFIEPDALRLLNKGLPYRRSGSEYTVYAEVSQDGGFFLRLRPHSELDTLSAREGQIARLYARGSSYKRLAEDLRLAPSTVRNHLQNIYAKLRVSDRDGLIATLESPRYRSR
jgi:DNA-binding CsgD family transcriptional regulator